MNLFYKTLAFLCLPLSLSGAAPAGFEMPMSDGTMKIEGIALEAIEEKLRPLRANLERFEAMIKERFETLERKMASGELKSERNDEINNQLRAQIEELNAQIALLREEISRMQSDLPPRRRSSKSPRRRGALYESDSD